MNAGEFLKNKRNEKNLSIQDVSFALKINPRVIKAIEDNIKEDLPASAITKGFVKSYAKFLKVDSVEDLHEMIEQDFGTPNYRTDEISAVDTQLSHLTRSSDLKRTTVESKSISEAVRENNAKEARKIETTNSFRTPLLLVAGGLLILSIIGIQKVIEKYQRDSSQAKMNEESNFSAPTEVAADPVLPPALSTAAGGEGANAIETSIAAPDEAKENLNNTEKIPSTTLAITPPASSSASDSSTVKKETPATTTATSASTTSPAATPAHSGTESFKLQNVEVIVEAKGDVEISYASKISALGKVKLKSGQVHVFKSKNGLKLIVNDGSLIRTAVNGVDKGVASSSNKAVTIIY